MAELTLKEKTAKGLFWGGISSGLQQILSLVFGIVLARILSSTDYGMVGMLAIFSAIASTIQDSGFSVALINKKEIKDEDYNAVFWFNIGVGVIIYILLFFSAPYIAKFYNKPSLISLSRFLFLGFLFGGLGISHNAILLKKMMVKEKAIIDIVSLVFSGSIGIIMAIYGYGYWGLAVQSTSYTVIGTLLRWYYSPWKPSLHIDFLPLKGMFGFSIKLFFTNIFSQISNNIFSVLLGKFYSASQVGYYSQGYKWMAIGHGFIGGIINGVAHPVLVQVKDEEERQKKIFRKILRFGAFISFPLLLGLAFVAKEFIIITVGSKWLPSVIFLQLFCIWGSAAYIWNLLVNVLMTFGKSDIYMRGMIIFGILQLAIVASLFPFGIYPMIVAYIFSFFLGLLGWQYYANKLIGISLGEMLKDILPYIAITLFCFFIAWGLTRRLENVYMLLISKVLISAVIYMGILWTTKSVIFRESLDYLLKRVRG